MSDIHVQRLARGWTVRHAKILFERFEDQGSAIRRARRLAASLEAQGEPVAIRLPPVKLHAASRQP